VDESGTGQDLEVMGDGGLALAQWLDEIADTDFAPGGGREDAEHLQADRVASAVNPVASSAASDASSGEDRTEGQQGEAVDPEVSTSTSRAALPAVLAMEISLTAVNVSSTLDASTDVNTDGGPNVPSPTGTERREPR
jgi:hypothetical protein